MTCYVLFCPTRTPNSILWVWLPMAQVQLLQVDIGLVRPLLCLFLLCTLTLRELSSLFSPLVPTELLLWL